MKWLMLLCLCVSCVPTPTVPETTLEPFEPGGVYVLCEGLWRQDNAVLSHIGSQSRVIRDIVSTFNTNTKLGDIATDMLVVGDTLIIAVNSSMSIGLVRKSDGKWLKRITMPDLHQPFHLALSANGKLYSTNINDDSITEFDAATMNITVPTVKVGPAPDGIAALNNKLYVANSGYGDLRKDEQGAGTIQIMSLSDLSTISVITDLPNPGVIRSDVLRNQVWALYRHYASQPDSLGGVVLIDGVSNNIVGRWRFESPLDLTIDVQSGKVYVLHEKGIDEINPQNENSNRIVTHRSGNGNDVWYSIGFNEQQQTLLVGNAKSYVTDGEVIEILKSGTIVRQYPVGPNPIAFVR